MKGVLMVVLMAVGGTDRALGQEYVSIPSVTPTSLGALLRHQAPPATVTGELYLPGRSSGPVPAMVLKHGSGGLGGPTGDNIRTWAHALTSWGIAAFVVDSFGPRGLTDTASNQGQLSTWADVADALAALKVLGADPRIDQTRIGIIGWSRGGSVAFNTALESVRKAIITGDLKFAAHVVLYGSAEIQYRDKATDQSPLLFLHGESDNLVPIGPTHEFADWIQTMGNAVTFVSYPKTYHDFDVDRQPSGAGRNADVIAKCDVVVSAVDGHVVRMNHKDSPGATLEDIRAYLRSCATRGATIAFSGSARADAVEKVHHFLAQALHLGA